MDLRNIIRDIPDWPKKGIIFKDITTLLKDAEALKAATDAIYAQVKDLGITKVVAIESRGFILGGVLALKLNAGFIPVRKPKKLPADTIKVTYQLEYGTDSLEMHRDAIVPGDRVLLHDDVLATGGTAAATISLIEQLGGKVEACSFIIELGFLGGASKLSGRTIHSLLKY
ncbi:MAG: adenine phosphoribosyltransferase [Ignavibacteriaceae bacterium]|nr:adenine phosphoribosyltransferase [Ignavibacteriaceae bacterium]